MASKGRRKAKLVPRAADEALFESWVNDPPVHTPAETPSEDQGKSLAGSSTSSLTKPASFSPKGVQTRHMRTSKILKRSAAAAFEENISDQKGTNPMTVHVVLNEVMKYLEPESLATCRLVNAQWNSAAVPFLRNRHPPIALQNSAQIQAFQAIAKKSKDAPFQNFKYQARLTMRNEKCFETFGSCVKSLQILSIQKVKVSFNDVFKMLKYLPNLKKMMLVNVEFPKLGPGVPVPTHATLTAPPPIISNSVETLNFTGWFMSNLTLDLRPLNMHAQQFIADVLNAVPQVKRLEVDILRSVIVQNFLVGIGRLKKLESLSIRSLEEKDLSYILRCADDLPNLKVMTFGEVHLNRRGEILLDLLSKFSNKLVHLDIRVMTTRTVELIRFPELMFLESLHLDTVYTVEKYAIGTTISPCSVQVPFPVLKKFVVSQCVLQGLLSTNFSAPTVTELILKMVSPSAAVGGVRTGDQDNARKIDVVVYLPIAFPALKKVKVIDIRCDDLKSLFGNAGMNQRLEELEICHDTEKYRFSIPVDLNSALTGLEDPALHCQMLAQYSANPKVPDEKKTSALDFILTCSTNSIRCMKSLKTLTFTGRHCIDNCSVQLALLRIPTLDKLIFSEHSTCFDEESLQKLMRYHKLVQVRKPSPPKLQLQQIQDMI